MARRVSTEGGGITPSPPVAAGTSVPWGEDAHIFITENLSWLDNSSLECVSRSFRAATRHSMTVTAQVFWGQAQSTEPDIEGLVPSLVSQRKVCID